MSDIFFIIIGLLSLLGGVFFCIRPILPSVLFIYGSMWLLDLGNFIFVPKSVITFWGIATMIVLGIDFLSPKIKNQPLIGILYTFFGAITGMFIAVGIDPAFNILGAFIGAVLGVFAFARTPKGKSVLFHTSTIIKYFCANGLRIVVVTSMIGVITILLLAK